MAGWKDDDEVVTTYKTLKDALLESFQNGMKAERLYPVRSKDPVESDPRNAKPASFVNIAFDSGRIAEQVRIVKELQEDAVISVVVPVDILERIVRIVEKEQ